MFVYELYEYPCTCMRNEMHNVYMYYLLVTCTDGDIQGDDVNKNSEQTRKHHLEYAWYVQ